MTERFRFDPDEVAVAAGPLAGPLDLDGRDLHVEVGFGKDVRILREAAEHPDARYLGVEISRKKSLKFRQKVARAGLRNVFAYHGDVRDVLRDMLARGSLSSLVALFPDPWPKRRHHKNRWIQEETAAQVARALRPGGTVVVATDHEGYADQIRACLRAAGLDLVEERVGVPDPDRTLFAQRFERLGQQVRHMVFRKPS
jgi:tRNA (guanine-N7-)-methyltransferase